MKISIWYFKTFVPFFRAKQFIVVQYSDAIRLALIHKYGGWYSDLDMVFRKPINQYKNVLACDEFSDKNSDKDNLGTFVSNAIFHFEKGHIFLEKCMEAFPKMFDGTWGSVGPKLLQTVLQELCGKRTNMDFISSQEFNPKSCNGIKVLHHK